MIEARESRVVLAGPNGEALVRKTPDVCGGDACVRQTRIMVWLLASYMRQGVSDKTLLEYYPSLNAEDLEAAREYGRLHPEEIEVAIADNHKDDD